MKNIILLYLLIVTQAWANYPVVQTGGGGVPLWAPTTSYTNNQHVNEADKLYRANAAFTSTGVFVPANWTEVSDDLNREAAVTDTALVIWDGVGGDDVKNSVVTLDGAGIMAGVTELTGNLTVNGDLDVLGTITTSSQAALDITNAIITVNVGGNQAAANANDAGIVVQMSDATDAQIGYDSTCPTFWQAGLVGSLDCVVTETIAQSLTNKELGNSASINANLYLDMVGTSKAARPFPNMTEVQRDALTTITGSGVYNTDTNKLNVYNGTLWKAVGGGLDAWITTTAYAIGDTVHESDKIYRAAIAHTSGVFATDLAANRWVELSDDLNREISGSVTNNALSRWDGTGGDDVQDSLIIVSDTGAMTGITALTYTGALTTSLTQNSVPFIGIGGVLSEDNTNFTFAAGVLDVTGEVTVDNLSLNGNTISSTDVNGNIVVDANGTGQFSVLDYFLMPHLSDPASSPAAASSNLFFKADEVLHDMDENGVVNPIDNRNANDILTNRSFEKSFSGTEDLGWAAVGGATTQTLLSGIANCAPGQGDQCLQIFPIAQTFTFTQNIACDTSDGQLVGFSSWIDTSTYDVEMCSLRAGVVQECITYPANGSWKKKTATLYARTGDTCGVQIRSVAAANGALGIDGIKFETEPIKFGQITNDSDWASYSLTIGATTTAPTKGTIVRDNAYWRRVGDSMEIRYEYEQSGGGAVGSGTYLFPLPAGYTIDTNKISTSTDAEIMAGTAWISNTATATADFSRIGSVIPFDSTNLWIVDKPGNDTTASVGSTHAGLTGTVVYTFRATIPITGWSATEDVASIGANASPNDMSASIIDGASVGTVTPARETQDFIQGNCTEAIDGRYVCTYVAGFFSAIPNCTASPTDPNSDSSVRIILESASSISVDTGADSASSLSGRDFTLSCDKTGADIKPVELDVNIPFGKTCTITDEKASGVVGGACTLNTWVTRDLNTMKGSCGFVSLSANQYTLVPGTYLIEGGSTTYRTGYSRNKIVRDPSGTPTDEIIGITHYNDPAPATNTYMLHIPAAEVIITASETFDMQQYCKTQTNTSDFGIATTIASTPEVYSFLKITKVK